VVEEPEAGLDPAFARGMATLLRSLARETGSSLIVETRHPGFVEALGPFAPVAEGRAKGVGAPGRGMERGTAPGAARRDRRPGTARNSVARVLLSEDGWVRVIELA
jgi:hypothetical protein